MAHWNLTTGTAARALVIVAMTPILWAGQCTPPAPACESAVGGSCPGTEIAECVGICIAPVGLGAACSLDPCAGAGLCEYGLTCRDSVCVRETPQRQVYCYNGSDGPSACPTGLYCHVYGASFPRPATGPGRLAAGQCSAPSAEGAACDSEWASSTSGRPCDAGLECLADPRDPARRACFRGCADAATDCPCPSEDPSVLDECVANVPELTMSEPGICAHCVVNGGPLEPGGWACCDAASTGRADVCCHDDGTACSSDADCCPSTVPGGPDALCAGDGTCRPCNDEGERVDPKGPGCCSGFAAVRGFCPVTCIYRGREVLEGASCGCTGRVVCDPDNTGDCSGGQVENFDCEDNDCDDLIDEGATPGACSGEVIDYYNEIPNFDGCPGLVLPGTESCLGGELVCRVTEGFCAWGNVFMDGESDRIDRGGARECFRTDTSCATSQCTAGEWCCGQGPLGQPQCSQLSVIDGVPIGDGPFMGCWLPGELNPDLECPYDETCFGLVCDECLAAGCGYCHDGAVCVPGNAMGPTETSCGARDWYFGTAMCPRGLPDAGPDAGRDAGPPRRDAGR